MAVFCESAPFYHSLPQPRWGPGVMALHPCMTWCPPRPTLCPNAPRAQPCVPVSPTGPVPRCPSCLALCPGGPHWPCVLVCSGSRSPLSHGSLQGTAVCPNGRKRLRLSPAVTQSATETGRPPGALSPERAGRGHLARPLHTKAC